jgi:hypothetical protein
MLWAEARLKLSGAPFPRVLTFPELSVIVVPRQVSAVLQLAIAALATEANTPCLTERFDPFEFGVLTPQPPEDTRVLRYWIVAGGCTLSALACRHLAKFPPTSCTSTVPCWPRGWLT